MTDLRMEPRLLVPMLGAMLLIVAPVSGQSPPLFLVDPETEVASVGFDFPAGQTLETGRLRQQLALKNPGLTYTLRSIVGWLPLISSPTRERFSPPTLLRDVVRLERFYRGEGFRDPSVSWDVALDTVENAVEVTFVVREGTPILLDGVVVRDSTGASVEPGLPEELRAGWRSLERELADARGGRLGSALRAQLQDRVTGWFRNRGYPYPSVSSDTASADTVAGGPGIRLTLTVDPGRRMRVGAVTVLGNERLAAPVLRREVPLQEGDWFSGSRLAEGQSELFGLDMVRIAVTDTERDSARDDRVNVRLRITEGALHLISAQLGYGVTSGVSGDASWRHRNFLGGARTLEIATTARTGLWAPETTQARRYGGSVTLRQPYLWDYRIEGVARPFIEYRDDLRDESVEFGGELSALYRRGPRRNMSLRYSLTSRRIIDAGASVLLGGDTDVLGLLAGLDTLDLDRRTSSFRFSANWAPSAPRDLWRQRDWGLFGSAEVTGPSGFSSVEYGRVVGEATGRMPIGADFLVQARVGGARLFPFGASIPTPDGSDRVETYLQLRDAVLTAGGPRDVRGWGSQLLGPKVPDLESSEDGSVSADRYLPLGGLARWTGSIQVGVPLPFVGRPHGLHTFIDAGRVWTPDGRFLPTEEPLLPGQFGDDVRFGTGVGVSIATPVGPVQFDVGYKLNPSFLDLRDPGAVARALADERPLSEIPADDGRRWHLHLSIGGVS